MCTRLGGAGGQHETLRGLGKIQALLAAGSVREHLHSSTTGHSAEAGDTERPRLLVSVACRVLTTSSALQGIPDSVTAVAWHPTQHHLLALGCSNGAVALLDTVQGALTISPWYTSWTGLITGRSFVLEFEMVFCRH